VMGCPAERCTPVAWQPEERGRVQKEPDPAPI
jgi:hypothetical protein